MRRGVPCLNRVWVVQHNSVVFEIVVVVDVWIEGVASCVLRTYTL